MSRPALEADEMTPPQVPSDGAPGADEQLGPGCACGCPRSFHVPDLNGAGMVEAPGERGACSACGCDRYRGRP